MNYDAERTIDKCETALQMCSQYLTKQAEMNATLHLSEKVLSSPLLSAVDATLAAIKTHKDSTT